MYSYNFLVIYYYKKELIVNFALWKLKDNKKLLDCLNEI